MIRATPRKAYTFLARASCMLPGLRMPVTLIIDKHHISQRFGEFNTKAYGHLHKLVPNWLLSTFDSLSRCPWMIVTDNEKQAASEFSHGDSRHVITFLGGLLLSCLVYVLFRLFLFFVLLFFFPDKYASCKDV